MRLEHLWEIKRIYQENTGKKPSIATVNPEDWEILAIQLGADTKAIKN